MEIIEKFSTITFTVYTITHVQLQYMNNIYT